MGGLIQDLRFAFRSFRKNPVFTLVSILTLMLGIGATATIFSLVDGVLIRPLPYSDPHRLVQVGTVFNWMKGDQLSVVSPLNYREWRDQSTSFESLAASGTYPAVMKGQGRPERIKAFGVSSNFFPALGAATSAGRGFLPQDERPEADRTVLLSHDFWQTRWGGDLEVLGQTLNLDDQLYSVIGVMPADFRPPEALRQKEVDVWVPYTWIGLDMESRRQHALRLIGKLKPGVSVAQARQEVEALGRASAAHHGATYWAGVFPLYQLTVGNIGSTLYILLGAVGLLLLMSCANVAHLFLARASTRVREMAMRSALGASQQRIFQQLLSESILLALAGGILGIGLAYGGVAAFAAFNPGDIPRLNEISVDLRVVAFAFGLAFLTGILYGLAPAWQLTRGDSVESLKQSAGRITDGGRGRLRSLLVVAETAVALVLLIAAGLLINSFVRLQRVDPGFDAENIVRMSITLTSGYEEREQQVAFFEQLVRRVQAIPGVQFAAAGTNLPMDLAPTSLKIEIEGRERDLEDDESFHLIGPDYFETLGIKLIEGRPFSDQDDANSQRVAIVSQSFARKFWPGRSPIGERLRFSGGQVWRWVVGVVGDIRNTGLAQSAEPELYFPYPQLGTGSMSVIALTSADIAATASAMRQAVQEVDANMPVDRIDTLEQMVSSTITDERFYALILTSFASVSLALAIIGLYGTMTYMAEQRIREVGIRMALGAKASDVLWSILRQGMSLFLVGAVIGLAGAWGALRFLSGLLYGVTPSDPATYLAVTLVLAAVALMACYVPAHRAARLDPMACLRVE